MRKKLIVNKREGTRVLCVMPGMGERMLPEELEWAETPPHALFSSMYHDMRRRKVSALYIRVSGMQCLDDVLEDGISERLFSAVLLSAAEVIGACINSGKNAGYLWFDTTMVYVADDGFPRFAYIPIKHGNKGEGLPEGHLGRMLMQLCDDAYPSSTDRIVHWRRTISDYAHRSQEYINLRSYCSLLEFMLGLPLYPTARAAVDLLNQRDPQYDDSPQRRVARQRVPKKDHWRGVNLRGSVDAFRREQQLEMPQVEHDNDGVSPPPDPVRLTVTDHVDHGRLDTELPIAPTESNAAFVIVRRSDGSRFGLEMGKLIQIGRGSKSDIQIVGNPKISRAHVAISCKPNGIEVQDLGSANGTWFNGRRLGKKECVMVRAGGSFSLADEVFDVERA